jgi:uncharacterized OsmC-like protein
MSGNAQAAAAAGAGIDTELASRLRSFACNLGSESAATEFVAVEVQRRGRFGHEAKTARDLTISLDEPIEFGGTGEAADPAEHLLAAVGASLSVTFTAHAALRQLPVAKVSVALKGEMDARAFFEPRRWRGRGGILTMTITLTVTTSMRQKQVRALYNEALRASPVFQSLKRRPRVCLVVQRD